MSLVDKEKESVTEAYECIPAFHFIVSFIGVSTNRDKPENQEFTMGFSEVSGLNAELQVEEIADGCSVIPAYKLPKPVKFPNLVLKRALCRSTGDFLKWIEEAVYNFQFMPCTVNVSLVGSSKNDILRAWKFMNVYPLKLKLSDLSSTKNEVVIETLELAYRDFSRL